MPKQKPAKKRNCKAPLEDHFVEFVDELVQGAKKKAEEKTREKHREHQRLANVMMAELLASHERTSGGQASLSAGALEQLKKKVWHASGEFYTISLLKKAQDNE